MIQKHQITRCEVAVTGIESYQDLTELFGEVTATRFFRRFVTYRNHSILCRLRPPYKRKGLAITSKLGYGRVFGWPKPLNKKGDDNLR
jgi:hypothetical protein